MNQPQTEGSAVGVSGRPARGRIDRYAPRVPTAIVAVGLLLCATIVTGWAVLESSPRYRLVEAGFSGVPALGVAYVGYRLRQSRLSADRYARVGGWCFGGLVGFFALNVTLMSFFPLDTLVANVAWVRWAAIFGAVGGLAIGVMEARAVERARAAERAVVRAEHVKAQRNSLAYLNGVLRHEVLNAANVVEGYADLLLAEHDPDDATRDRLERIRRQSRNMAEVIRDVRVLIEAAEGGGEFAVVDLGDVLADVAADLRSAHDGVAVDVSVPGDAFVAADDLLPRVFSNLLANAVEHNDGDGPRVSVSAETTPETVTVRVADDRPGVPEVARATLFERTARGTSHGLGLYLVRTLARRYGGDAELVETGPAGSVFAVELPRVPGPSSADGGSSSASSTAPSAATDAFAPSTETGSGTRTERT